MSTIEEDPQPVYYRLHEANEDRTPGEPIRPVQPSTDPWSYDYPIQNSETQEIEHFRVEEGLEGDELPIKDASGHIWAVWVRDTGE